MGSELRLLSSRSLLFATFCIFKEEEEVSVKHSDVQITLVFSNSSAMLCAYLVPVSSFLINCH